MPSHHPHHYYTMTLGNIEWHDHLSCKELQASYNDINVFANIDLRVEPGESLCLKGPNGSGKTTLLNLLAGVHQPDAGVMMFGENLLHSFYNNTIYIGLKSALKTRMSIRDNLMFWASFMNPHHRHDIVKLCQIFALQHLIDQPVYSLSTGQIRQISLLRLLLVARPIWLLDEPLNGLDQAAISTLTILQKTHRERGGLVLFASHQNSQWQAVKTFNMLK